MQSYLKAIVASLVAGLGSLAQALDNDNVSAQEWVNAAITALVALGVVWGVPNLDPKGKRQRDSVQPPNDRGEITLVGVLIVAVLIALVLAIARMI